MLERLFKLKSLGTNVRIETLAGITTFMTMAYIIFVNPAILSTTGMDFGAVMVATCVGSMMTTIVTHIDWKDYSNAILAFLTIMLMPLSFSIANGLAIGFISFAAIKLLSGRGKEVNWFVYTLLQEDSANLKMEIESKILWVP